MQNNKTQPEQINKKTDLININKYLASAGCCSRRQADEIIRTGRVKINDKVAKLTDKVAKNNRVELDGKVIKPLSKKKYLVFNKPIGVISTTDKNSPNNIIDAIRYPERIFPVGRLDVNTSGLIIMTNDGDLAQYIAKAKKIEKEYLVNVDKTVTEVFINSLEAGVFIEGHRTLPAKVKRISDKTFTIAIIEGKKRQVRRMCEKLGYNVVKLQRIRIGNIELNNLRLGEYKELKENEIKELLGISR